MSAGSYVGKYEQEINDAEIAVDNYFNSLPLPSNRLDEAILHLCTVSEDRLRLILHEMGDHTGWQGSAGIENYNRLINDTKFSLNYAIANVCKRLTKHGLPQQYTICKESYECSANLLDKARDYFFASILFIGKKRGQFNSFIEPPNKVFFIDSIASSRNYSQLERTILNGPGAHPISYFCKLFMEPELIPIELKEIYEKSKFTNYQITYKYFPSIARILLSEMEAGTIIPESWQFPWCTTTEFRAFFLALITRAFYHLICVHFGAGTHGINGGGVECLCLRIRKSDLIAQISELSLLDKHTTIKMVNAICYGEKTITPDIALQPLIALYDNTILIAPLNLISSNFERNGLTLHARVDPSSFNKQSHQFENIMLNKALSSIKQRFSHAYPRLLIPNAPETGDIDLAIFDLECSTLLICEMRWTLH